MSIDNLDHVFREDYQLNSLEDESFSDNPFIFFKQWFNDLVESGIRQPNAMVLSTANLIGDVSSRVVLLKDFDEKGFVFFTDYRSRKGSVMSINSKVSLLFYSIELERQIRIEGQIEKVSFDESNAYFKSRPLGSQLAAMTSVQSSVVESRLKLDQLYDETKKKYESKSFSCPDYWGGYRVVPSYFEFWQGRSSRMHDRIIFELSKDNHWTIKRLFP